MKLVTDIIKNVKSKVLTKVKCLNCNDSGAQCSNCSPVFRDTFGE